MRPPLGKFRRKAASLLSLQVAGGFTAWLVILILLCYVQDSVVLSSKCLDDMEATSQQGCSGFRLLHGYLL